MAPNSRIVKYLISLYRNVLCRQWIARRQQYVAAVRHAVGPWPRLQMARLEPRVLLSTVNLVDVPLATYTGAPTSIVGFTFGIDVAAPGTTPVFIVPPV